MYFLNLLAIPKNSEMPAHPPLYIVTKGLTHPHDGVEYARVSHLCIGEVDLDGAIDILIAELKEIRKKGKRFIKKDKERVMRVFEERLDKNTD